MGSRCVRTGLTLVEVLVVIGVISLLIAVLMPAVQMARGAARGIQCKNNLKQLALGCDLHHEANGVYPPGQLFGPVGIGADSTGWSWLARLLPYVGEQNLYTAGGIPKKTLRESGVADKEIKLFLCPSDSSRPDGPRLDAGNLAEEQFAVGHTNYKGVSGANWGADESQNMGPGEIGTQWTNIGTNGSYDGLAHGDGMFFRSDAGTRRRKSHVLDGLSRTFMIGEDLPKYDAYCSWPYANNAYSTCAIPPNRKDATDPRWWPDVQSFRSDHSGGLHFAFVDGSVQFIDESIDLSVYRAMATIRGAETVVRE